MNFFRILTPKKVMLIALLSCALVTNPVLAQSAVKLQNWSGKIDLSAANPVPFTLAGTASHLGKFTAYGEVDFVDGDEEGSLVGDGVIVFEAANGDLLVGVASWDLDQALGHGHITHVSWRDFVEFSDGSIVESTGHFAEPEGRPPGLISIEYIIFLQTILIVIIGFRR